MTEQNGEGYRPEEGQAPTPPPPPPGWSPQQPPPAWPQPPQSQPQWGQQPQSPPAWGQQPQWGRVPQAPKPGVVPLRPLALGEVLDGAVGFIRTNPRGVLGLAAGLAVVSALIQMATTAISLDGLETIASTEIPANNTMTVDDLPMEAIFGSLGGLFLGGIALALVAVVASGLFITLIAASVLGRDLTAREAWDRTKGRIAPLIGISLLVGLGTLAIVLAAVALGAGAIAALGDTGAIVLILLVLLAIPLAVWLYVRWTLAPPALILENIGVLASMKRSSELVKGLWWRIFGITVLASILVNIVASVIALPASALGAIFGGGSTEGMGVELFFSGLATLVSATITLPFQGGITGLLYIDSRMRREALDLRLQQAQPTDADPLAPYRA